MRLNVMDRIAEDLRRYRVYTCGYGYEIRDTKQGFYTRVVDPKTGTRFFRNRGRAQKVADKLEAEHVAAVKTDSGR